MPAIPKTFQIGFNKCATRSLCRMFRKSGLRSVHHKYPVGAERQSIAARMRDNLAASRPVLDGMDGYVGYFDLEQNLGEPGGRIDGFKEFRALDRDYPGSFFVLNYRDKAKWLQSRARHKNGNYLARFSQAMGFASSQACLAYWSEEWDAHLADVRAYFAQRPGQLIEYNIDTDHIGDLAAALPYETLDTAHYAHVGRSGDSADLQRRRARRAAKRQRALTLE